MKNVKNIQLTNIPRGGGHGPALLGRLTDFRRGSRSLIIR